MDTENVIGPVLQKKIPSGFPYLLLVVFVLRVFILVKQAQSIILTPEPLDTLDSLGTIFNSLFVGMGAFILSLLGIILGLRALKQRRSQAFTTIVVIFSALTLFPEFIYRVVKFLFT